MRAVIVVAIALLAVAYAAEVETEVAAEAEVEANVPILPGLGMGCLEKKGAPWWKRRQTPWLFPEEDDNNNFVNEMREGDERPRRYRRSSPKNFGGRCAYDKDCPNDRAVYGECAGMGVVCCSHTAVKKPGSTVPPRPSGRPVLQAGNCASIAGQCIKDSQCNAQGGTINRGMCPGDRTIICCTKKTTGQPPVTPPPAGGNMAALVRIPPGINAGVTSPSASFQTANFGSPGCPLTAACFSCTCQAGPAIRSKLVTQAVTPTVRITGLKPFVEAVARALEAAKNAGGAALQAYQQIKSAGGFCCRPIKQSNGRPGAGYSNHSWGAAVDFYFGSTIDPRGDGKTQQGLLVLAPFFNREKLYWAAGYSGGSEDAMHFEASREIIAQWKAARLV